MEIDMAKKQNRKNFKRKEYPITSYKQKILYRKFKKHFSQYPDNIVEVNLRPIWLRNPNSKYCFEIDMFVQFKIPITYYEYGIQKSLLIRFGIEVQGDSHYQVLEKYDYTFGDLQQTKERDAFKLKACKDNHILLLTIDNSAISKVMDFKNWLNETLSNLMDMTIQQMLIKEYLLNL